MIPDEKFHLAWAYNENHHAKTKWPIIYLFSDDSIITEDDSKQDRILLVKIYEYIGFCVYRRSYLLGSRVIVG